MCDPALSSEPDALSARIASLEDKLALMEAVGASVPVSVPAPKTKVKAEKKAEPEDASKHVGEERSAEEQTGPETTVTGREALPYFGELISRAVEKNPFIEGFRRFITGWRVPGGFELECENPFTEKICTDNKVMLTELLSIFEHRIVTDGEVAIVGRKSTSHEHVSLDL